MTLELDDRFLDAAADGFDAVIRHGPIRDNRLIAKRLASSRRLLAASPAYLAERGRPRSVSDLEVHRAILYTNRDSDWRFPSSEGAIVVRPPKCLRLNNGLIMRDAALAGLGLTLLPTFMMHAELQSGALQVVDLGVEAEGAEIYIAYSSNRSASAKVCALTKHLRKAFGSPPSWDAGLHQTEAQVEP